MLFFTYVFLIFARATSLSIYVSFKSFCQKIFSIKLGSLKKSKILSWNNIHSLVRASICLKTALDEQQWYDKDGSLSLQNADQKQESRFSDIFLFTTILSAILRTILREFGFPQKKLRYRQMLRRNFYKKTKNMISVKSLLKNTIF